MLKCLNSHLFIGPLPGVDTLAFILLLHFDKEHCRFSNSDVDRVVHREDVLAKNPLRPFAFLDSSRAPEEVLVVNPFESLLNQASNLAHEAFPHNIQVHLDKTSAVSFGVRQFALEVGVEIVENGEEGDDDVAVSHFVVIVGAAALIVAFAAAQCFLGLDLLGPLNLPHNLRDRGVSDKVFLVFDPRLHIGFEEGLDRPGAVREVEPVLDQQLLEVIGQPVELEDLVRDVSARLVLLPVLLAPEEELQAYPA
mmetsp:Transcript_13660/g.33420  ORF Transcript_13660/g.33420 Transcript_13660/m.33420 type:complete len:252 (+) Transcript_13660:861-1616(+)